MASGSISKNKLGSAIKRGASLAGDRFKNDVSLPNQHDNNAKLFGELSNSFGARPGDRPRGAWRNLASGLFMGLEHGQKAKSIEKNQEKFDKYDKVMNYLTEVNNSAIEQNQWYADQEKRLEAVRPFAVGGLEISYSGMPYNTGNERMRNVMEQAKIADPTIQGDYIGYVPNTPIVNLRDKDGNIIAYSLSNLVGEDVVKRVQGNYIDQQKLDVEKFKGGIPDGKYGVKGESSNNPYGSVPLTTLKQGGGGRAILNSINSEINLAKDIPIILHQLDEAENIINKNPAIGTSWNNFVSKGSFSKGFMDKDLRHAYEKLEKIASRVEEAYVKAKGTAITDAERATIKKGLFDSTLQGKSSAYNINTIREELAIAAERGKFASEELAKGFASTSSSFDNYMKSQKQPNTDLPQQDDIWNQIGNARQ